MAFSKILLAIDDSQQTQDIVKQALEIAQIHQAQLMLFRCITNHNLEAIPSGSFEMGLTGEEMNYNYQQQEQLVELTKQALAQLKTECETATNREIAIDYQSRTGEPGHWICETAREWDASLIIVGKRGYSGLVEAFVGSVSNYVVHHAPCPVLVIQSANQNENALD